MQLLLLSPLQALLPLSLVWLLLHQARPADGQCNPATSVADPRVGIVDYPGTSGDTCYFPFSYGGLVFYDCDGLYCDGSFCGYWCATSCNYAIDYSAWRFCRFLVADLAKPNCAGLANMTRSDEIEVYGGSGSGTSCYFPFMYNDICYDDCIDPSGSGEPWCSTTEVMYHVSTNQRKCRATRKGLRDTSCAGLNASEPVYLPQQTGTYGIALSQTDPTGNCTFPFYYKEKCYDDCTTVDAQKWDLPWCLTEKYYQPNKRMRVCPHYRKYKEVSGLALGWGFFYVREHSSCGVGGSACNSTWSLPGSSVPTTASGSSRMALTTPSSLSGEPIEVMPQPNGFFILKLPLKCSNANWSSVSLDGSEVGLEPITVEREFWNIKTTSTDGVFTVQSMRNSTRGKYLSFTVIGTDRVLSLSSSAVEWRFDKLSDFEMASFGLPCENPTTTNGSWCPWSEYMVSGGISIRNRSCSCPRAIGGLPCEGNSTEVTIPVNGSWCAWSPFTHLADGFSSRVRSCNCSAPAFGGADCPGPANDTGRVVNGSWCEWSPFNVTGAQGVRSRVCNCSAPEYGGSDCPGFEYESGPVINGTWCAWSPYNVTGSLGIRTRVCNCSAPEYGGSDCPGSEYESGSVVNGNWCAWSPYNVIGSLGTRTRVCNCSAPQYGGTDCPGNSVESGSVVNGSWCSWSAFNVSGGIGTRTRACNCSAPAFGGADCYGSDIDSGPSTGGAWCAWSGYSGNGTHETRLRECNCSQPRYGGADCPGSDADTGRIIAGNWCPWSAWSSTGFRNRTCACPASSNLAAGCSGPDSETGGSGGIGRAYPAEPGEQGAGLSTMDAYKGLVAWCVVICMGMLISVCVGLALMVRHVGLSNSTVRVSSVSQSTLTLPPNSYFHYSESVW